MMTITVARMTAYCKAWTTVETVLPRRAQQVMRDHWGLAEFSMPAVRELESNDPTHSYYMEYYLRFSDTMMGNGWPSIADIERQVKLDWLLSARRRSDLREAA